MKLRRREVAWLAVLGGVLIAVQGLEGRTRTLRERSARAGGASTPAAEAWTAGQPGGLAGEPGGPPSALASGPEAALAGAGSVTITAADLAALPWGGNPFRAGAGLAAGRSAADDPDADAEEDEAAAHARSANDPPRLQGIVRSRGRLLAALDGRFCAPGDDVGLWRVQEVLDDAVTVRQVRTGRVCTLRRERPLGQP
jgi:hypothetical protein